MCSISGSGRSLEKGNTLQYSCLENTMDRGAWWATFHGITKSWTRLKWFSKQASKTFHLIRLAKIQKLDKILLGRIWVNRHYHKLRGGSINWYGNLAKSTKVIPFGVERGDGTPRYALSRKVLLLQLLEDLSVDNLQLSAPESFALLQKIAPPKVDAFLGQPTTND